jgi:hypothetical protein
MNAVTTAGLDRSQTIRVNKSPTVPPVSSLLTGFADGPPVFATAYLVGICIEVLKERLRRSPQLNARLENSALNTRRNGL